MGISVLHFSFFLKIIKHRLSALRSSIFGLDQILFSFRWHFDMWSTVLALIEPEHRCLMVIAFIWWNIVASTKLFTWRLQLRIASSVQSRLIGGLGRLTSYLIIIKAFWLPVQIIMIVSRSPFCRLRARFNRLQRVSPSFIDNSCFIPGPCTM